MGVLTADMKRVVSEQRLGFIATVCPDGTPNLSFKGTARVLTEGRPYEEIRAFYRSGPHAAHDGVYERISAVVLVRVERALPLVSPAYDGGATEEEVAGRWERYWETLRTARRRAR